MIIRILMFLIIPIFLHAQNADEVIKNLQDKFATIKNLKSNFSQTIYSTQSIQPINFEGKFYYKKENSFSIAMPDRDIISDGVSIWNYDRQQKKVVISTSDSDNTTFSLNDIIYLYPEKCDLSLLKTQEINFIVKAVPNDVALTFKEAYLTISKNFILNKIEIIDFNNIKYTFQLFDIKINTDISDTMFNFVPSVEVEVIDLR